MIRPQLWTICRHCWQRSRIWNAVDRDLHGQVGRVVSCGEISWKLFVVSWSLQNLLAWVDIWGMATFREFESVGLCLRVRLRVGQLGFQRKSLWQLLITSDGFRFCRPPSLPSPGKFCYAIFAWHCAIFSLKSVLHIKSLSLLAVIWNFEYLAKSSAWIYRMGAPFAYNSKLLRSWRMLTWEMYSTFESPSAKLLTICAALSSFPRGNQCVLTVVGKTSFHRVLLHFGKTHKNDCPWEKCSLEFMVEKCHFAVGWQATDDAGECWSSRLSIVGQVQIQCLGFSVLWLESVLCLLWGLKLYSRILHIFILDKMLWNTRICVASARICVASAMHAM